ncbi:Avr9/Cf-9 rapidly elicited protein [Quillaja saponaria]|uniref:Avr9/Cf-9 rapidly elicited protein n=1 Tax=Quillaja saponaria TaxID=32244 RepID=A0AAD7L533_QUISA|nr:Avr9/Cf-9 rapidly elicited protein [Quillaja saponaria]
MEHNLPVVAKRVWSIMRVVFFMLRKSISKGKLMTDLNMMMKRGKIAGKAISNLMFHHHHHHGGSNSSLRSHDSHISFSAPREYEFSCSNTPNYFFPISKRHRHHHNYFFTCAHAPPTQEDEVVTVNAVKVVLEMFNNEVVVEASPALPGFGRSPMVRQLRITDSPFPLNTTADDDNHVDEAAEEFIKRFYKELNKQKRMAE